MHYRIKFLNFIKPHLPGLGLRRLLFLKLTPMVRLGNRTYISGEWRGFKPRLQWLLCHGEWFFTEVERFETPPAAAIMQGSLRKM